MKRVEASFDYLTGGIEHLDRIEPLWKELNTHHQVISQHFSNDFANNSFIKRKQSLVDSTKDLLVEIAVESDSGTDSAYCITALKQNRIGEIESIYTKREFRGRSIGDTLMQRALRWLESHQVEEKHIAVVHGNEMVWRFYKKYGFFPRVTILRQKDF